MITQYSIMKKNKVLFLPHTTCLVLKNYVICDFELTNAFMTPNKMKKTLINIAYNSVNVPWKLKIYFECVAIQYSLRTTDIEGAKKTELF